MDTSQIIIAFVVGYALGSVPFGLLLTKFTGAGDIRSIGSGNIGATNVLRTGRKGLAAGTLLGDMLKGTVAVLLMRWWAGSDAGLIAALGAVVGHIFPVWLKFKGGKGVATYIGVLLAVSWIAALIFGVVWGVVAWLTRYSSLSGLAASGLTPVVLAFMVGGNAALLFAALTALVWYMHRANIQRLLAGTESKIGQSKTAAPEA
ncbi:glycerol-3-phosphate 1-O-acyltransferase PlsY [Rhodoplanes sp. Z2-YC6860]|uniref:glycerol-3-phosphate 1-O-acyltransferase PlsY n=1 Tax=Rhodoplanes sp. Z2-YC6860 TaxID=674703 RepID=UPI00078B4E9A|nr:glycerol-3-phosphate 1-O-acyltransferase PlsY [Rhodoplanes sp. Z2-YC6860]AMN42439.1 glycerol-3-phosphate acyltransferase [Rhodoplanes sp. Z2-YC6860]